VLPIELTSVSQRRNMRDVFSRRNSFASLSGGHGATGDIFASMLRTHAAYFRMLRLPT
jgi:hypothetical protein